MVKTLKDHLRKTLFHAHIAQLKNLAGQNQMAGLRLIL
jgi:hypothetical protein